MENPRFPTASAAGPPFRVDIQGLRAIAVGIVVLDHVHLLGGGFVGVDVFFVISGFLISGHLLRELARDGSIDLVAFWSRRMRRILPAALLVLVATSAAALILMPPLSAGGLARTAAAVAAYVPNVLFAAQGTDYLAGSAPSPFQHFWSLGVEEQFYVIWPIVVVAAWAALRRSTRAHRWIGGVIVVIVVASFISGVLLTDAAQPWAFFSLPTRAWELAAGGFVALLVHRGHRLPAMVAPWVGWAGLAGIVLAAATYSSATSYPGTAVLLPVLSSLALIWAGSGDVASGPVILLQAAPLQYLGRLSYSLYLWHWPLLVVPQAAAGLGHPLPEWTRLVAVGLALLLAHATYRFVEVPMLKVRVGPDRRRAWLSLAGGVVASASIAALVLGASGIAQLRPETTSRTAEHHAPSVPPEYTGFVPADLQPMLSSAAASTSAIHRDGCHVGAADVVTPPACVLGDPDGHLSVALVGDSHAAHWYPALERWARLHGGVQLLPFTKAGCPVVDVDVRSAGMPVETCRTWRSNVLDSLRSAKPDVVLVADSTGFRFVDDSDRLGQWLDGTDRFLRSLPQGTRVVVLANTPQFPDSVPVCLSARLEDTASCAAPRSDALDQDWIDAERATVTARGHAYVDLNDWFCDDDRCGAIIGDVLLYRDFSHLTEQWSASLWQQIGRAVEAAR